VTDNGEARRAWHATAVSWGQFLVALVVAVGGVIWVVLTDRIAIDRRLTIMEERERASESNEKRELVEYALMRSTIDGRLTDIQRQLVVLTIELTKHEAAQNTDENRRGLKLPR